MTVHVIPLMIPTLAPDALAGNTFTLSFSIQPGVSYVFEQATNLAAPVFWETISKVVGAGESIQMADPGATNDMRFYRVRIE
jgi:hypothetical protein